MVQGTAQTGGKRIHFIAGVWLTWTVIATLSYARNFFDAMMFGSVPGSWAEYFVRLFGCFYPWALLTPLIFRVEQRFALTRKEWKGRFGILLFASLIFSYVAIQIGTFLSFLANTVVGRPASLGGFPLHFSLIEFGFEEFFFWSTLGAVCAIRHFVQFHRQARQATQLALEKSQLEASLRQAELENLRMRLNPHFLFNTLQNVSVLAQRNPKLASQMLTRLGDLLRVALRRDNSSETTVREEMALTQDYLTVEKMRFGDRLTVLVDVAEGTERALLPSFLLQPLAENAVIHGLRGASQVGTIAMRAMKEGDRLVLTVADNGLGLADDGSGEKRKGGIGLSSTRERLAKMYPGEHEFVIRKLDEGGTEVRVAIPFRQKEATEENAASEQPSTVDC